MGWLTLSKALERSQRVNSDICLLSMLWYILSVMDVSAAVVAEENSV